MVGAGVGASVAVGIWMMIGSGVWGCSGVTSAEGVTSAVEAEPSPKLTSQVYSVLGTQLAGMQFLRTT